jgi:predicted heme/steroid binding protein
MNLKLISTMSVILIVVLVSAGIFVYEKLTATMPTPSSSQSTNTSEQTLNSDADTTTNASSEAKSEVVITEDQLTLADGKNGNKCYVVVDNIVYSISGFVLWADGVHSPSGGKARCGKDLSSIINQSPHGKSKLNLLQKVGVYQNEAK